MVFSIGYFSLYVPSADIKLSNTIIYVSVSVSPNLRQKPHLTFCLPGNLIIPRMHYGFDAYILLRNKDFLTL